MAKNNKNAAAAAAETKEQTAQVANGQETTVENIEEQIKNENKFGDNVLKEAEAQIQKEKDEKKVRILKDRMCKADYVNKRELLELKKRRKEAAATKESLTATKEALDELKVGKITPTEYDDKLAAIDKTKREAFNNIDKEHNKLVEELRNGYTGYYSWDWEFEHRRW